MQKKVQSLNALRTFEVCARTESVQEAASLLHVTPSAVSHQLRKLEEELGVDLFFRSHRKITPTEKGRILQKTLTKAFTKIAETLNELINEDSSELVINVLPVFSIRWLNPRLLSFFNQHPEIGLTIKNSYHVEDLSLQRCDIAIRWGSGQWPGTTCEKLFDEYVLPAARPDLLSTVKIENQEELLSLPLIQTFEGANHWEMWAEQNGYQMPDKPKYIKFNDPSAALQAAVDGLGVVLGPITLVHNELTSNNLVAPFGNPIHTNNAYYLATPKQAGNKNINLIKFQQWIREEAKAFEEVLAKEYNLR
ncbi:MAG: LysR substrate-binding domain-containing protein [Thalassotalea sp.]|nr:LysR substrate-binding domain-containing protein [Thalassotalea sp.]